MSKLPPLNLPPVKKSANYDSIDPLDGRYWDAEASRYLSERAAVLYRAHVEAALALTLADYRICPPAAASEVVKACQEIDIEAVYKEEQLTKHDIKALVNYIKSKVSNTAKPYVHLTATSYDIISSAQALQYKKAIADLVLPRLTELITSLISLVERYAETTQIGRTHGQHALPITFGFALSEYVSRLGSSAEAIADLTKSLRGKFSGAVGAHNAISLFVKDPLEFEKALLGKLELEPAEYSTQIAPPEQLLRLLEELTNAAGIMTNFSHDMRHLQRSEIAEIRESFSDSQTGSSTMAHKRNPVSFENVASLNKQVVGQLMSAQANLVSEHQRDLTDSASSRFYPVLVATVAEMTRRLNETVSNLSVNPEAMQKNLHLSGGAVAAEPLYLLLAKAGHTKAHETAKQAAIKAQDSNTTLVEVLSTDVELLDYWEKLSDEQKQLLEEPERYYTGIAATKANAIADNWRKKLHQISK